MIAFIFCLGGRPSMPCRNRSRSPGRPASWSRRHCREERAEAPMWKTNLKLFCWSLCWSSASTPGWPTSSRNWSRRCRRPSPARRCHPEALVTAGEKVYLAPAAHRLSRPRHSGSEPPHRSGGAGTDRQPMRLPEARSGLQGLSLRISHNPGSGGGRFENIMTDMRRQMSEDQIWAVIAISSPGGRGDRDGRGPAWRRTGRATRAASLRPPTAGAAHREGLHRLPPVEARRAHRSAV